MSRAGKPPAMPQSIFVRSVANASSWTPVGGYLPHRFSKKNGYDNPSVYCDDLYSMFENMQSVLESHLYVSKPDGVRVNVRDTLAGA